MKHLLTSFVWLILVMGMASPLRAQDPDSLLEAGKMAFMHKNYAEAVQAFEKVTDRDPNNAEAYFLLARLYAETPLKDRKKANHALDKARSLEPDNLSFMVAELQQLREDSWSTIIDRIREQKRIDLAHKILKIDSTNAFAHEELGEVYIHDFWKYRNAVMMPMLRFRQRTDHSNIGDLNESGSMADVGTSAIDPTGTGNVDDGILTGTAVNFLPENEQELDLLSDQAMDPNEVFMADHFDLDALKSQGVPFQDLSARAERAYKTAIGHLEKSLEADPRRRSVYDSMMRIFALKGEYEAAAKMLQQMYVFFPDDAELWTYLGLTHYRLNNMEAASKAFETAFQYMGDDVKNAYTRLDEILPNDEKKKYEEHPVEYAARYWTSKDPRFLTPYNERKLEHYARLTYADLLYGKNDLGLHGWDTQRGNILVRYGTPKADIVFLGQSRSIAENRSVDRIRDKYGNVNGTKFDMFEEMNTYDVWDYGDFRFVFEDPFRNGEFRLYSPSATDIAEGVEPWLNDYAIRAKETFAKVPERYEYEAPGRQIEMPYLVTAFKGADDKADLYVNYGIPITEYSKSDDMIDVTANVGSFLINDNHDILFERRRTIYGLRTSQIIPFEEVNLWVDTQKMQAPAGDLEVSMEFETASGNTVAVQRRDVEVPDFFAGRLALSDVMFAYGVEETSDGKPIGDADVVRRNLSITPAPWGVYSTAQPIYLYYEVYNLEKDAGGKTDYEIEAVLVPKDDAKGIRKIWNSLFGGEKGVAVKLPNTGTSSDDGQYTILDASDQEPGIYTLVLRVHDNVSGDNVETEHDLFLEK